MGVRVPTWNLGGDIRARQAASRMVLRLRNTAVSESWKKSATNIHNPSTNPIRAGHRNKNAVFLDTL